MPESLLFPGRYLTYDLNVFKNYPLSSAIFIRNEAEGISVAIHDSDPYWLGIVYFHGKPVILQDCILDYEKWIYELYNNQSFIEHIQTL